MTEIIPPNLAPQLAVTPAQITDAKSAGFITPDGNDPIRNGDDAITNNAVVAHELIEAATPYKGVLPDGTDIDTVREAGIYTVSSTANARTMINWPSYRAGILTVNTNKGSNTTTQDVICHVTANDATERYSRSSLFQSGGFSPWGSAEWTKGVLRATPEAPINIDTFRQIGAWIVSSRSDITGLPGSGYGILEVYTDPNVGVRMQRFTERVTNDNVIEWRRFSLLVGGWAGIEWSRTSAGSSGGGTAADPVSDHAGRVEYARSRRGGGIGTAGRPVVMLRFDHWLEAFRDKVLPIMQEFDLPGTLNMNYDNLSNAANGGGAITWEDVQDWNQYSGIEIANHGSTHTNASTRDSIYHEIVDGRRNLESAMPRVAVETWQEHGSAYLIASDEPGDIGLDLGRTPANFFESYAGKLVVAEHAVIEGKSGGFYHPINGHPQIGQSHISVDRSTAAEAIAYVEQVQAFGRGVTLYVHPGTLDSGDDFMTTAAFRELCAHLAAERDAGRLMVMTAAGGAFADRLDDHRENLIVAAEFGPGWEQWWTNYNEYTVTEPGENVVLTSATNAVPMTQRMLLHSRFGWAMGATHELVVRAKAIGPNAQLTLRAEQLGNPDNWQTERVFTPTDEIREYRMNITLPRDPNIKQMTFRIGGPDLEIHGSPLLAAI